MSSPSNVLPSSDNKEPTGAMLTINRGFWKAAGLKESCKWLRLVFIKPRLGTELPWTAQARKSSRASVFLVFEGKKPSSHLLIWAPVLI